MENPAAVQSGPRTRSLFIIYLFTFLVTLHLAIPAYINSSFLAGFTTEKFVGLVFSIGSFLTIVCFIFLPKILRRIGNYRLTFFLIAVEFFSLIGMALSTNALSAIFFFAASFISTALLGFSLDLFVENFSFDNVTGNIRGSFLTAANIAWLFSPLMASLILTNGDYWKIFLVAAAILLPTLFLLRTSFKTFQDPTYESRDIKTTAAKIWANRNLSSVFLVSFLLQFFYAWMVIFTPIYLHEHLGFSWQDIGVIFSIMLLPFILIELPLGKLADSKFGEKEAMAIGFIIMSLATAMMGFLTSTSFAIWAALLFITRVGAATVEIMSETYFFKNVTTVDANTISVFRTMRPFAYVLGPLIGSTILVFFDLRVLFVILGGIVLCGLFPSLKLKDTL